MKQCLLGTSSTEAQSCNDDQPQLRNAALPLLAARAAKVPRIKRYLPKCRPVRLSVEQLDELNMCSKAKAVIIFIAGGRTGFTQPLVWKQWRESAGHLKHLIAFCVYVDPASESTIPSDEMGHWVCPLSDLGSWGGYNLVRIETKLYDSVLKRYSAAQHFYVVRYSWLDLS